MMTTTPEIEQLVDKCTAFVIKHRKEKAFIDWTEEQIRNTLRDCCLSRSMLYCSNEVGDIIGVVHGIANHGKRVFHTTNILTTEPKALPLFIGAFIYMFPGYTLHGMRYDKLKVYDTMRFRKKVLDKFNRN